MFNGRKYLKIVNLLWLFKSDYFSVAKINGITELIFKMNEIEK